MKKTIFSLLLSLFVLPAAFGQVAEWRQYQGPYSGNVTGYASVGDTLYCSVDLNSIYKSIDGGYAWTKMEGTYGDWISLYGDSTMILGGKHNDTFVTFNNGKEWIDCAGIKGAIQFYTFANQLFATTDQGIFVYDSATNTWIDKSAGLPEDNGSGSRSVQTLTSVGDSLFCGTLLNGIYYSADTAKTWTQVPPSSGFNSIQVMHLLNYKDTLFAFTSDLDRTIYVSGDTGRLWTGIPFGRSDNQFNDMAIFNDTLLIATDKGLYKYDSNGASFSMVNDKPIDKLFVKDSILLGSNHNGMFRWNQESHDFILSNTGINSAKVYALTLFDSTLYAATPGGVFYTSDDGETWSEIQEVQNFNCTSFAQLDTTLYIGTWKGVFTKSLHSNKCVPVDNGLTTIVVRDLDAVDSVLFAATDGGLFKSVDNGKIWVHIDNYADQVIQLAHGNNMVLALTTINGLYQLSSDGTSLNLIGPETADALSSIDIVDSTVYVGTANLKSGKLGYYESVDSCKTWNYHQTGIIISDMFKRGNRNIYAAGSRFIYSPDNGKNWQDWSETGIPDVQINFVLQCDSAMYAGTLGNSIFKREYLKLTDMTSDTYEVGDSTINNLPSNTTADSLEANVDVSHGASAEVVGDSSGTNASMDNWGGNVLKDASITYLHAGDQIKVIAEDGVTTKIYTINTVTGIKTVMSDQPFFYPNPVTDKLNISQTYTSDARIIIFDMQGKKVLDQQMTSNEVNVANLPKGVYIVELLDSGKATINKLLKE